MTLFKRYFEITAGYCIITYVLGVGDRHLDNLLLTASGTFWKVCKMNITECT